MTAAEIQRIVSLGVEMPGVRELRITGGEPLIRPDLAGIIAAVRERHSALRARDVVDVLPPFAGG